MRARRAERIQELHDATSRARNAGAVLFRVRRIRQYARTGTKCYLEHPDGTVEAAWFGNVWPYRRELIIVRGQHSTGGHHGERVLYVNQVVEVLDSALWRHRRQLRRLP